MIKRPLVGSPRKQLPLYWWRYEYPAKLNFGDEVTPYIIERLFHKKIQWSSVTEASLIGAGSILEYCQQERSEDQTIAVWGSGFISKDSETKNEGFEYYAVRGRISATRAGRPGITVGDPGILMSYAYPELYSVKKEYDIGVIPHYADADLPVIAKLRKEKNILIIDPLASPIDVARQINKCGIIFSSSLHGLIFADSYNIPNYWTPLSDNLTGGSYKFNDYYSAYGERAVAKGLLDSVKHWQRLTDSFVPRDVLSVQKALVKAFPKNI